MALGGDALLRESLGELDGVSVRGERRADLPLVLVGVRKLGLDEFLVLDGNRLRSRGKRRVGVLPVLCHVVPSTQGYRLGLEPFLAEQLAEGRLGRLGRLARVGVGENQRPVDAQHRPLSERLAGVRYELTLFAGDVQSCGACGVRELDLDPPILVTHRGAIIAGTLHLHSAEQLHYHRSPRRAFLRGHFCVMKTYVARPSDRQRDWYVVDASGKTLGRLATQIAVTGNKRAAKLYHRHSGYPGGLRTRTFEQMIQRRPEEVIRLAVKGMMPRNRLAHKQLTKLKVYAGPEHPHVAQKPSELELRP